MKNSEIQVVRTSGAIVSIFLMILCGTVLFAAWARETGQEERQKALKKAEVVGYQIAQLFRESAEKDLTVSSVGTRMPASAVAPDEFRRVGTMSLDPWGQPYQYRLLTTDPKGPMKVLVWSAGPNKTIESSHLKDEEGHLQIEQLSFMGDDLGVSLSL